MARQNIQFKGLRHSPSDITGQDGDLLECVNLIHENGELKPIEMPEKMMMRGYGKDENVYILVAVHNLTDGKKFVFARFDGTNTNIIVKRDGQTAVFYDHAIMGEEIQWAETIGTTLIIGTDKSTHYAIYKNGNYKWLGDKLPQPVFDFNIGYKQGAQLYLNYYEPNPPCKDINGDYIAGGGIPLSYQSDFAFYQNTAHYVELENVEDENKRAIRDNFKAKMAELLDYAKKNNRFVFPFFVRYALKLYDNTYVMHSAPLLMLPSTDVCPILAFISVFMDGTVDTSAWWQGNNDHHMAVANLGLRFIAQGLAYRNIGFYDADNHSMSPDDVSDWSDIIKGVDIFLSSEICTYNPNYYDDIENLPTKYYHNPISTDYGKIYISNSNGDWSTTHFGGSSPLIDIDATFYMGGGTGQTGGDIYKNHVFPIPSFSKEYIMEKIKNTNVFHKIKSYDLHSVKSTWSGYKFLHEEIEYGNLVNLETYPVLPDDYISRSRLAGKVNYNYNQRLLLGDIELQAPLWYKNTLWQEKTEWKVEVCFVIEKQDKTIYVRSDVLSHLPDTRFGHFIYYPDPDCKKVIIHIFTSNYDAGTYIVPMYEHTGLHGAYVVMPGLYSFLDFLNSDYFYDEEGNPVLEEYNGTIPSTSSDLDRYYQQPNTIAMSSVANPFHFPASNFKDIGRTKVVGIAANTLDVSSGQWGQYPLYVFCSDGIIAIIIDGEGKFGGIQAVSSDVLREPRGLSQPTLVQTGQALMFLTQRGVMAIGGTQIKCLSEAMNGRHFNPMRELADVDYHIGAFANLIGRTSDDTDFRDFAASGFLAYDYAHHRVLLLRSDRDYQYVYSLNTGFWSKQIIYTNLDSFQVEVVPGNELPAQRSSGVPLLKVKPIRAAVNNYTEMYLQDEDGWLYKTMEVQGQNSVKQLYQYGYIVSRPIRFGTDEYKTIVNALHRYNHYAKKSFVRFAMYGSRDGVKYGRINTLRGMSYQYFIFVIYTYLKPNERYSYLTIEYEKRLTNKPR
jgi:hypothetical protein